MTYISVDIEASGPIPQEYSMLSLGACLVDDTDITFYRELRPLNDNFVQAALEVTGLDMQQLKERGAHPKEAMQEFAAWIQQHAERRPIFVGYNAAFDWQFINYYFLHFLNENPFGFDPLDIKAVFMGRYPRHWDYTTLAHAKNALNMRQPHTHNALKDAIEQAKIFRKVMQG